MDKNADTTVLPGTRVAEAGEHRALEAEDEWAESSPDAVVIRKATGKGRGVYANRDFAAGERVVRGVVERAEPHRTMHSFQKDWDLHVELDEVARSINHSCSPNTGVVDNAHGGYDFVALTAIRVAEEITWDYETTEYESIAVGTCLCASTTCRGRTRGFRYRTDPITYAAAYLRTR
ncbi:SET domain-containing protein [Streptomyces globisporus]